VWPQWFRDKYKDSIVFTQANGIAPVGESKLYGGWLELVEDVQKAIDWDEWDNNRKHPFTYVMVFLHECGGLSRVEIRRDTIIWTEPDGWSQVCDGGTHDYCYGCSAADRATPMPVVAFPKYEG
jgi:hypothetical protein